MSPLRQLLLRTFRFLTDRAGAVLLGIILLLTVWLGWFLFRTLYQTVIEPTPIDEQSVTSREEKLNITLYEWVTASMDEKRSAPLLPIPDDPF